MYWPTLYNDSYFESLPQSFNIYSSFDKHLAPSSSTSTTNTPQVREFSPNSFSTVLITRGFLQGHTARLVRSWFSQWAAANTIVAVHSGPGVPPPSWLLMPSRPRYHAGMRLLKWTVYESMSYRCWSPNLHVWASLSPSSFLAELKPKTVIGDHGMSFCLWGSISERWWPLMTMLLSTSKFFDLVTLDSSSFS